MFQSARVQLTLWYLIIIMFVSGFFSIAFYNVSTHEIDRIIRRVEFERERRRDNRLFLLSPSSVITPTVVELQQAEQQLKITLIFVNLGILVLAGGASYFLAGRTLQPISEMVEEQNRFITDASHELRTPLTALRTEIEANLLDKKISSRNARALIQSNLEEVIRLQKLSDDLLELAQYKRNKSNRHFEKISIKNILEESLKKILPIANKKKITLNSSIQDLYIEGEKNSLIQLIIILLDNALKYTHSGGKVDIKSRKQSSRVILEISDTGIGIEEKNIPYIFDRFFRADSSRSKNNFSGYGLGLAIGKKIVLEHNGIISVKSKVRKGTIFTLSFPLKKK